MGGRGVRKMVLKALVVVALVYLFVCALLYFNQERLIFYPEVTAASFRYAFPHRFDEVTWQVDGATIHALHFKVEAPRGVVYYLHGNAGSLRSWGAVASDFIDHSYDVLIPDYRGYGKSTGRIGSERMLLEDARVGYEYLKRRYPEDRIVVYGRSVGTGIAVYVAESASPKMLILESPYYSLRELARRQFPFAPGFLLKYPLRTDRWISEVSCPTYLFHGTRDELVPYSSSLRLLPLIKAEHELFAVEGGGHNDLGEFASYHEGLDRILR
jgi:fermentation-respiration switch protein FrsA (DUF1100 family)